MVSLDARRTATDGIVPGIDVVRRSQTIDIDVCFGPSRNCYDWVQEVARVERDHPWPELFDQARRRRYVTSLRHHPDPRFEFHDVPMQVHASIHENVVFEAGSAHRGNEVRRRDSLSVNIDAEFSTCKIEHLLESWDRGVAKSSTE